MKTQMSEEKVESTLKEGEDIKITITIQDGDVICSVEAKENPAPALVIGAMEIAKADILAQVSGVGMEGPEAPQMDMTVITLTDEDFILEGGEGELTAKGYKVGDSFEVPTQIAELRQQAIVNLQKNKLK